MAQRCPSLRGQLCLGAIYDAEASAGPTERLQKNVAVPQNGRYSKERHWAFSRRVPHPAPRLWGQEDIQGETTTAFLSWPPTQRVCREQVTMQVTAICAAGALGWGGARPSP